MLDVNSFDMTLLIIIDYYHSFFIFLAFPMDLAIIDIIWATLNMTTTTMMMMHLQLLSDLALYKCT